MGERGECEEKAEEEDQQALEGLPWGGWVSLQTLSCEEAWGVQSELSGIVKSPLGTQDRSLEGP